MTIMERKCEDFFKSTTTRENNGQYTVRLPFTHETSLLGRSKEMAIRRFYSLESRLSKSPNLKDDYHTFMKEYLDMNHMEEIFDDGSNSRYYIPHHCILKPDSSSTKLRVVFDASAKTTTNYSLNEILATGPTIQDDLFNIISRFRLHQYVFTADISKMYRQILVNKQDRKWQTIVWRFNEKHPLQFYQLKTVTYGTTTAPYLATRCLQQLAEDEAELHPIASKLTKTDFYVDDVMTGSDDLHQLMKA